MVDDNNDILDDFENEDGDEDGSKKKRLAGRTLVLFIILPLIGVLVLGYGALSFFTGGDEDVDVIAQHDGGAPSQRDPTEVDFKPIEEFLVNIRMADDRLGLLSLTVSLEVNKDEDSEMLEAELCREYPHHGDLWVQNFLISHEMRLYALDFEDFGWRRFDRDCARLRNRLERYATRRLWVRQRARLFWFRFITTYVDNRAEPVMCLLSRMLNFL